MFRASILSYIRLQRQVCVRPSVLKLARSNQSPLMYNYVNYRAFTSPSGQSNITTPQQANAALIEHVKAGTLTELLFSDLLNNQADLNAPDEADEFGNTALMHAIGMGNAEMTSMLLAGGANLNATNKQGVTPLGVAQSQGYRACFDQLLMLGADPNIGDVHGTTPLHHAASREDLLPWMEALIKAGADVNAKGPENIDALIIAAASNNIVGTMALVAAKADVTSPGSDVTALMMASLRGYEELVRVLIGAGSNVDQQDMRPKTNYTALGHAARSGHHRTMRILLNANANVNIASPSTGLTALMEASLQGHMVAVQLLIAAGADIDQTENQGYTALHMCVHKNNSDVARLLLKHGADRTVKSTDSGNTPLMLAVIGGYKDSVQVLATTETLRDLNQAKSTPLMLASMNDHPHLISVLVKLGAEVDQSNDQGLTALMYACAMDRDECVQELLELGASKTLTCNNGRTAMEYGQAHPKVMAVLTGKEATNTNDT